MNVNVKILDKRATIPTKATSGSAGFDLKACIDEDIILYPGESKLIPTGLAIHINDKSVVGCLFPRSKLGHKQGVVLGNLTGIIDSDYTGQWFVSVWNRNFEQSVTIKPFEELAQVVFLTLADISFQEVNELTNTERNDGGISKEVSTGITNTVQYKVCSCGSSIFHKYISLNKQICADCGNEYKYDGVEIKHQRG